MNAAAIGELLNQLSDDLFEFSGGSDTPPVTREQALLHTVASWLSCVAEDIAHADGAHPSEVADALRETTTGLIAGICNDLVTDFAPSATRQAKAWREAHTKRTP